MLTQAYLQECLQQARFYEYCKDSERALIVLEPIWSNIEEPPHLEELDNTLACEILLVCGSVISSYGTTHQKKFYQELAADMLTNAREMAAAVGERDLIAEAEKQVAVAYWRHGQFENAVAYSNTVLSHYTEYEQLTNKICLLTQANLLMLYTGIGQPSIAFEIFEKIKFFVEDSDDLRIKTVFYNQASGLYAYAGKFEQSIPLLEKTVEYATLTDNNCYLGNALNNLANAYIQLSDAEKAMVYVNRSIDLFLSINQEFSYAQTLETKAQIYLKTDDLPQALSAIDESISLLEKGENYAKLCESLWTRMSILLKSGERVPAIRQYNELIKIVKDRLSQAVEDSYVAKFDKLLYVVNGGDFDASESNFRKRLLDEALEQGGGLITATAKSLGVDHQRLSKMVSKYPDLKEKHNVRLITRRKNLPVRYDAAQTARMFFALELKSDRLQSVGLQKGQIVKVRVREFDRLDLSQPVVIRDAAEVYHCGFLIDMFGLFAFQNDDGDIDQTFTLSDINLAGSIVGVYDAATDRFLSLDF